MIKHSEAQQKAKPPLSYEDILGIPEVMGYPSPRERPRGSAGVLLSEPCQNDLILLSRERHHANAVNQRKGQNDLILLSRERPHPLSNVSGPRTVRTT